MRKGFSSFSATRRRVGWRTWRTGLIIWIIYRIFWFFFWFMVARVFIINEVPLLKMRNYLPMCHVYMKTFRCLLSWSHFNSNLIIQGSSTKWKISPLVSVVPFCLLFAEGKDLWETSSFSSAGQSSPPNVCYPPVIFSPASSSPQLSFSTCPEIYALPNKQKLVWFYYV